MKMITNSSIVSLERVSFAREDRPIFDDFSLEISSGEYVALLGTNGSGKSTLLDLITGHLTPSSGKITAHAAPIAVVPQHSEVLQHVPMTVWNAVSMGRWTGGKLWKRLTDEDRTQIGGRIEQLGLAELSHRQLAALSGGLRQRTLIAQALVQEAPLILLDEPEAGLDTAARATIRQALREAYSEGTTIVIATHELDSAREASRCIVLKGDAGGIIADGPPEEVLTNETLANAFT